MCQIGCNFEGEIYCKNLWNFFLNEKDEFIIAIRQKFSYPKRQIKIKEQNKNWKKK